MSRENWPIFNYWKNFWERRILGKCRIYIAEYSKRIIECLDQPSQVEIQNISKKLSSVLCQSWMIFVILGQRFLIPRDNYPDEECNLYRELEIKRCQGSTMGYSLYQFFVKLKKFAIFISVSGIEFFSRQIVRSLNSKK